jgi:hypothetical protein
MDRFVVVDFFRFELFSSSEEVSSESVNSLVLLLALLDVPFLALGLPKRLVWGLDRPLGGGLFGLLGVSPDDRGPGLCFLDLLVEVERNAAFRLSLSSASDVCCCCSMLLQSASDSVIFNLQSVVALNRYAQSLSIMYWSL